MIEQTSRTIVGILASILLFSTPLMTTVPQMAFATSSTGLVVSLYDYPGSSWTQLIQEKHAHPSVPIIAVINPNNGPGSSIDSNYANGIQQMQAAGITVLGYVHTSYGTRSTATLESEMDSYHNWYHVDGIAFDEMANTDGYQTYYSNLSSYAKSHGMPMTFGNPGANTLPSYIGTVDTMCIYEDVGLPPISYFSGSWFTGYPKSDFCMIAIGTGLPSQTYISNVSKYVGYVYVTDAILPNPYDVLPSYLDSLVAELDTGSSGTTVPQAPTGLTATAGNSQVTLSWTAPSNNGGSVITGYNIYRGTAAGAEGSTPVATGITSTTYTDTGLTNGQAYYYAVKTVNSVGTSSQSNEASATPVMTPQPTTASLTVNSANLAGTQFSGMWVELHASNGTTLATGYTPTTFTVTTGVKYIVYAANYQSTIFDHWTDGTTNSSLTITPTQNTTLTAYYSTASSPQPTTASLTVNSANLAGTQFSGMWVELHASNGTTLATGYTPTTFTVTTGVKYIVYAANYQSTIFDHWTDGTTNSSLTITPTQNTTLTAYYSTPVTLTVKSADISGVGFSGMWTVINSNGKMVASGYTPLKFSAQSGNTYTVTVSNYNATVFSHWNNGSTNPTISITPAKNTLLVAYYNT